MLIVTKTLGVVTNIGDCKKLTLRIVTNYISILKVIWPKSAPEFFLLIYVFIFLMSEATREKEDAKS